MKIKMHINAALICMGIVLAGLAGAAAIPAKINYQGVLKDAAGAKVDGTVDIDLNLLPLGGGTAVFSESHSGVSVVGGLFSLKIGGVNDMSAVSFDAAYELELTIDGDLLSPNTPLCSAPYALGVVGGAQGPQGKQGPAGNDGNDGNDGAAGTAGTQGAQGKQGDQGPAGPVGSEFWDANGDDIINVNTGNVFIKPKLGIGYSTTPIHNTSLSIWQNGGSARGNSRVVSLLDRDINPAAPFLEIGFGYEHSNPDRNMQPVVIGYEHTDFTGQGAGAFYIATRLSSSGSAPPEERLRVSSDGKIGISESDPQELLHLRTSGPDTTIRLESTEYYAGHANAPDHPLGTIEFASSWANLGYFNANPPRAKIMGRMQNFSGGAALVFYTANSTEKNPSERMRIIADGTLQFPGGATCNGTTWANASTREAKKNIEPLSVDVALQTLGGLDPVTFEYKDATTPDGHVGFIAEDVPEIVAMPDRKGLVTMDIVGVLTAVVKEQQKLIEQQRADYESLKAQVEGTNVNN